MRSFKWARTVVYAMVVVFCACDAVADLNAGLFSLRIASRSSYLSGVPVLVRVEVLGDGGRVERGLWDAKASLRVDMPDVTCSPAEVRLYNGLGSALVTFSGSGDFKLTAELAGLSASRKMTDLADEPVTIVSGTLATSDTWRGLYHVTGGDFQIPDGVVLTLDPGTLVMIDGVTSGSGGPDINVSGSIHSFGTPASPVTFTAFETGKNWGELHLEDAELSTFQYTNVNQGGHSPGVGHSGTGPTFRVSNSALIFDHTNVTDNAGKLMHATSGSDLTFQDCLFARCVMGPEMSSTALLFESSWITEMSAKDDADGIYIHSQRSDQSCTMRGGVVADIVDDGIDLLGAHIVIEDCVVRDCDDKGISAYNGVTLISHCLVVNNNRSPEDPTVTSIGAKATSGATTLIRMDHTTVVSTRTPGVVDFGIQSHNKRNETRGSILWTIRNCIIDATDPIDVQAPYLESDVTVDHSNLSIESWSGPGNLNTLPAFVDPDNGDYHLQSQAGHWDFLTRVWSFDETTSPCIDAGCQTDPIGYEPFPNGGIVNMGFYAATPQASRSYFNGPVCETIVAGDINGDCVVDFQDLALLASHWVEDNTP